MNKLYIYCITALILVFTPTKVVAIDQTFNIKNDIFFSTSGSACGTNSQEIINIGASEGKNIEAVLNFFTGKGLTLAAAAGFAGNMKQESGLNPAIIEGGSIAESDYKPVDSVGFGLVQWTFGGTTAPRQGGLYQLAQNSKIPIIDIGVQLEYIWRELNTSYKTSTLDKLGGISDPIEAAVIIHDNYEISADSDADVRSVRGGNAKVYFDQYRDKIVDGTGATVNASTSTSEDGSTNCVVEDTSDGGIGVADGFTFPLKTTKAAIKKGSDNNGDTLVWCYSALSPCHHDYDAADIHDQTGVPIIAAVGGDVVKGGEDSVCGSLGCNVTIKGEDGLLYFYTHMSKPATVYKGEKVSAGDMIGTIGTNATAAGTARHLHFDVLPESYNTRPGCSSASCSTLPFINPQKNLVPAYEALPEGATNV